MILISVNMRQMFIALVIRFKHTFDNGWNFNQNFAVQNQNGWQSSLARIQVVTFGQKINKVKLIIRLSAVEITADTKLLITLSFAIDNRLNKQFDLIWHAARH